MQLNILQYICVYVCACVCVCLRLRVSMRACTCMKHTQDCLQLYTDSLCDIKLNILQ